MEVNTVEKEDKRRTSPMLERRTQSNGREKNPVQWKREKPSPTEGRRIESNRREN
jgi:hypothetical protein